jgi:nicotinamidase-related amidase
MKQLIVIDMQKDFIDGALGNAGAKHAIPYVAEAIKNAERPVVFTRDTHFENYAETLEGKKLPVPHCIEGTPGHEIVPELLNATTTTPIIIDKITFGYTGWKEIFGLADDIDEFVIMGTVNPICPTANAILLRAAYPNKKITVDFSGCGFMPNEVGDEFHCREATKYVLNMQQIDVIND